MDMMSLDSLSPEELDALEKAIASKKEGGSDPMQVMANVLQWLVDSHEELQEKFNKLSADYYDGLLGGIKKMYDDGLRVEGLKGFGEKHGAMLGPFADDFKRVSGGGDLLEKAFDYLEGMKGSEGFDEGNAIQALVDELKGRLSKPEPAAVDVEVAKVEPAASPAGEGESSEKEEEFPSDVVDEIARQKKRDAARAQSRKRA